MIFSRSGLAARFIPLLLVLSLGAFPKGSLSGTARPPVEPCYEIEGLRLEETLSVLNRFAREIWPGWDNFRSVDFRALYPDKTVLLFSVNPDVPEGFEAFEGIHVPGRNTFIDRKDKIDLAMTPPLTGGGGASRGVRIRLRQRQPEPGKERIFSSDEQILLYIHEFFHGFQKSVWTHNAKSMAAYKEGYEYAENAIYAAYREIEGKALLQALREKDMGKSLEALKDFLVARELKHRETPESVAVYDRITEVSEGTAVYASLKAAQLILDKGYKPGGISGRDPYFFEYEDAFSYIRRLTIEDLDKISGNPYGRLDAHYTYGGALCLLLDRFVPDWKSGFFENDRGLDEIAAAFCRLEKEEKERIRKNLDKKYGLDRILKEKESVFAERDTAIGSIKARRGVLYIIDAEDLKQAFRIVPRKREYAFSGEQYFPDGVSQAIIGEVLFTGEPTPIRAPSPSRLEWVDTEARPGKERYTLHQEGKTGDVYLNATLTTPGFTLKAPFLRIQEKEDTVLIQILGGPESHKMKTD